MRLEESEKADAIVVEGVVRAILDRGDAADRLSVAERQEKLAVGRFVKRISRIERVANGDAERRYPLRMVAVIVDLPRQIDKSAQVAPGLDGDDLDGSGPLG